MLFQVYQDRYGDWRWRLWGDNHSDVIADSGEGYASKEGCLRGIARVKTEINAPTLDTKKDRKPTKDEFLDWKFIATSTGKLD